MNEHYLGLLAGERLEVLEQASASAGRPIHLLEKDVWVVWALSVMFESPHGEHLVFKGGTSLSKVYKAIGRFSEDVDLTYDIRVIASDLVGASQEGIPPTPSQEKRWTREIKARLIEWVRDEAAPLITTALDRDALDASVRVDDERLFIDYVPLVAGYSYIKPAVMLEFGARSTGEPAELHDVTCDAAELVPSLSFPKATPRVLNVGRTFWEKATAIHVFCVTGIFRGGDRFARHWHDIAKLDETGFVDAALADRDLALSVARHKTAFFGEKTASGEKVDYGAAVSGAMRLVPEGEALTKLSADYSAMVTDGLLLNEAEPFGKLLERCQAIEERANSPR